MTEEPSGQNPHGYGYSRGDWPGAQEEIWNESQRRTWEQRDRVELDVEDDESLASILDRAGEQFNLETPDYSPRASEAFPFVALYDEEAPGGFRRVSSSLTLVDEEGRAVWNVFDFDLIPYSQLLRSVEAGVLRGDPRRILLPLQPPSGNGPRGLADGP